MKKLLITLILFMVPIVIFSQQTKRWNFTDTVAWSHDSVYYPDVDGDISGYTWTGTVITELLSAPITIGFGSSNYPLDSEGVKYQYANHGVDSLPYTFDPTDAYNTMTNGSDIDTGKVFHSGSDPWGFERPGFYLDPLTDTTFIIKVYMTFTKQ